VIQHRHCGRLALEPCAADRIRRNISADDVGNAALYLCGPLASNVSGHILMVDAGYSILGMSVH